MPQLFEYQRDAVAAVQRLLDAAEGGASIADAFDDLDGIEYTKPAWTHPDPARSVELKRRVPMVQTVMPTGAGKTTTASAMLARIGTSIWGSEGGCRLVVWITPTTTLVDQTLRAMREADWQAPLIEATGLPVQVLKLTDLAMVGSATLSAGPIVAVTTAAAIKADPATSDLHLHRESPRFDEWSIGEEDDAMFEDDGIHPRSMMRVFAGLRPIVVCDEMHRMGSGLSMDTLTRLHPRWVLGLTATPRPGITVIHRTPPMRVKEAGMLNLPLTVHPVADQAAALAAAVDELRAQQTVADGLPGVPRPLLLVQAALANAEASTKDTARTGGKAGVDGRWSVKDAVDRLVECGISPDRIAVHTGESPYADIASVHLADSTVEAVVTVKAAAEGWDCPRASILAMLATTSDPRSAEQLIGRIIRRVQGFGTLPERIHESHVFLVHAKTDVAVRFIRERMESLGYGHEEVRTTGSTGGTGLLGRGITRTVHKRTEALTIPQMSLLTPGSPALEPSPLLPHELAAIRASHQRFRLDVGNNGVEAGLAEEDPYSYGIDLRASKLRLAKALHRKYPSVRSVQLVRFVFAQLDLWHRLAPESVALRHDDLLLEWLDERVGRAVAEGIDERWSTAESTSLVYADAPLPERVVSESPSSSSPCPWTRHLYGPVVVDGGVFELNGEERAFAELLDASDDVHAWVRLPERGLPGGDGRFHRYLMQRGHHRTFPDFGVWDVRGRFWFFDTKGAHLLEHPKTKLSREAGDWHERRGRLRYRIVPAQYQAAAVSELATG